MRCLDQRKLIVFFISLTIAAKSQAPPTAETILLAHKISITRSGLEAALTNTSPEIRGLAAGLLAEHQSTSSMQAIKSALEKEKVPYVKSNFAVAMSQIAAHQGDAVLESICSNKTLSVVDRLVSALRLISLGNNNCDASVVAMLADDSAGAAGQSLKLDYLRRLTNVADRQRNELLAYLNPELSDRAPINRQYASDCLAVFGDTASLAYLKVAVANEADSTVKSHMLENLKRIQSRLSVR